jgi:hypothetical protein
MGWPLSNHVDWWLRRWLAKTAGRTICAWHRRSKMGTIWGMGGPAKLSFNPAYVIINKWEIPSRW